MLFLKKIFKHFQMICWSIIILILINCSATPLKKNSEAEIIELTEATPRFLSKLIAYEPGANRQARSKTSDYYGNRYGVTSRNAHVTKDSSNDRPDDLTATNQHNVERRCLRCEGYYNDDRKWYSGPSGGAGYYDRRYDERRSYEDRRYDPNNRRPDYYDYDYDKFATGPGRPNPGRWDDRYLYGNDVRGSRYDRNRPYYDDRYDYRYRDPQAGSGGVGNYPSDRGDPYYDMRFEPRRPPSARDYYDNWSAGPRDRYDRYDMRDRDYDLPSRGGYSDNVRPWDETYRGSGGWDRGYYSSTGGRPDPNNYWGSGYDRGYAQGWNYSGNRDDWRDRDQYGTNRPRDPYNYDRNNSSTGSGGYRGSTSYLYDRDGRPAQLPSTTPRNQDNSQGSSNGNTNSGDSNKDNSNSG